MAEFLSANAIASVADILWDFVELKDILQFSVCSRTFAQLPVPAQNINRLIARNSKHESLGRTKIVFGHDLTTGLVRRILNRVHTTEVATISIDDRTGRIVLDIGSAFNKNDAFLASEVTPVIEPEQEGDTPQISKEIEITSYDEYDDFNPRHPAMKERKGHRRDDSLFNSDIDHVTQELGHMSKGSLGFDLSTIAAKAAQDEASNRETHTSVSVKNRILARKTQSRVGLPPTGRLNLPADS